MAKKASTKKGPSKSQTIRDVAAKMPGAGPTEVAKAAAEKLGIKLTPSLVSQASTVMKGKGGKKKGKPGRKAAAATNGKANGHLSEAIKFIKSVGSVTKAQAAVDEVRRMVDSLMGIKN